MHPPTNLSASFQLGSPSPMRQRQASTSQALPMSHVRPTVDYKFHQHVSDELKKELEVRMILETKLNDLEEKVKESESIKLAYHNILADNQKLTQMVEGSSVATKNVESKIGILIQENEKLRKGLESKTADFDSLKLSSSAKYSEFRKENDKLKNELRSLESFNEQLFHENSSLKREATNLNESQVEKNVLEEEIDAMRKELFDIQEIIKSQREELEEYQELEEKSEVLVMENQKLNSLVVDLKESNSNLSAQLSSLTNRSRVEESVSTKFKERFQEVNALREQIDNISTDYQLLQEEHFQLKDVHSSLRKEYEEASHSLLEKKHEIELWKSKIGSLEHRLHQYEGKEDEYQASISEFQSLINSNEELAEENRQMASALADFEGGMEAMRVNRANQEALIKDYMQETETLRKRAQDQQILLSRMKSTPLDNSEPSNSKYKRLVEENGMLLDKVEEQEEALKKSEEFMKHSDEFLQQNSELQQTVAALEEQLEYWRSRAEVPGEDREEYIKELEAKVQLICEENEKIHEMYLEKCDQLESLNPK